VRIRKVLRDKEIRAPCWQSGEMEKKKEGTNGLVFRLALKMDRDVFFLFNQRV